MTTFATTQDIENDRSISSYEEVLKKLSDEIGKQEIEKRDKVRFLEYLQQAIKDKQVELRLENEELKSRYAELNKTKHYVEAPPFADMNLYDESTEADILANKIKELEAKINMLQNYNTSYPNSYANQQYVYPQLLGSQHNRDKSVDWSTLVALMNTQPRPISAMSRFRQLYQCHAPRQSLPFYPFFKRVPFQRPISMFPVYMN